MDKEELLDKLRKMLFYTQQANECGLSNNDFKEDIQVLSKTIELIENILKERQADKEKIKELEAVNKMQEYRINEMDIPKTLIEEEINRLKYDVSKIKEIKQTRYSDYDRIRLSAYVTKSNEIIKRLEKCVNKR